MSIFVQFLQQSQVKPTFTLSCGNEAVRVQLRFHSRMSVPISASISQTPVRVAAPMSVEDAP